MKIYSVYDDAFKPYGRVADGYPVDGLMEALANTPLPEHVTYQPREEALHAAIQDYKDKLERGENPDEPEEEKPEEIKYV